MPKISQKAIEMPSSPIRKLVPYATEAKKRGVHVLHLNIGQPDIKAPQVAIDAIKNLPTNDVAYTNSEGVSSYQSGLVNYYKNNNINLNVKDIMITTGGSEALVMVFNACFNDDDEILVPEPFYANYNGFARQTNINVVPITASIENDFALPPIADFEKKITPKTKAIMICNPSNPTGYLYSLKELEQLKEIVLKHDLFLIADEVYREFCYDGHTPISILELDGLKENAIVIDSVSKRYSMCGARIGAIVTRNNELISVLMKFAQARLCPPYFGQVAAEAALNTPKEYFEEVKAEYVARRNYLVEALNKIEGVYCPMPKGAFYAVVKLPVENADEFAKWLLEEFEYKGTTVMVAPASGFYSTPNHGMNEVRVAYVLKISELKRAVIALEEGLRAYKEYKNK
ncbi:MAG: pyridoxal phosphate-dependent aminotransferase [Bacteroidetes bacterium]|nr:pyridoxal phosphate-dependent aminotransferase [Bacteroidota bacterium]